MNDASAPQNAPEILVVSPFALHAGHYWNNAEELAIALMKAGQRVTILVSDTTARPPAAEVSSLITTSPSWWRRLLRFAFANDKITRWGSGLRRPFEMIGVLFTASRFIKKRNRSVIIHFIDGTFLVLFAWQLFARQPCVYNLMGGTEPLQPIRFLSNPFRSLKRMITLALLARCIRIGLIELCAETEAVRRDWAKIVANHVHRIPYAISPVTNGISRKQARTDLHLDENDTILLLFGIQREGKDISTVIRAAKQISPQPFLLFVGKHLSGPNAKELVRDFEFTDCRIIDRFVTEEESALYFAACDAVVLPYAEGYDRGSGVLLEACQYLRPVIATDTGHLREFVREHGTGCLFHFGDAESLGRCMKTVAHLTLDERRVVENTISQTVHHYSWERIVHQYVALYRSLINKLSV